MSCDHERDHGTPEAPDAGLPFDLSPDERRRRNHARDTGRFQPGNVAALKHGATSEQVKAALSTAPEVARALSERRQAIERDLGGPAAVSQIKHDAITTYCEVDMLRQTLAHQLATEGMFTAKKRMRASFGAYLQVADRLVRLAQLLGLERQTQDIGALSAADYLRSVQQPDAIPAPVPTEEPSR